MAAKRDYRLLFGVPRNLWVGRVIGSSGTSGSSKRGRKHCKQCILTGFVGDDKVDIRPGGHKIDVTVKVTDISPYWSKNDDLRELKKALAELVKVSPMYVDDMIDRCLKDSLSFEQFKVLVKPITKPSGPSGLATYLVFDDLKPLPPISKFEEVVRAPEQVVRAPEPLVHKPESPTVVPTPEPAPMSSITQFPTMSSTPQPQPSAKVTLSIDFSDPNAIAALQEYQQAAVATANAKAAYEKAMADELVAREIAESHGIDFGVTVAPAEPQARPSSARTALTDRFFEIASNVAEGTAISPRWLADQAVATITDVDAESIRARVYSFVKTERFLSMFQATHAGRNVTFTRKRAS